MCRILALVGIAAALFLPATGCEKRKAAKPRLGEVERLPRVETAVLGKPAKLEVARTYTVTLEAMEKADLCAMVKGNVKDLPEELDRGKVVTKGKLLFSLHVPDLIADYENKKALVEQFEKADALAIRSVDVAKAEVRETRALVLRYEGDAEYRRAQHARVTKLAQGDTLSRQQMDEAKSQLDAAESALAAAKAQVATREAKEEAARAERDLAAARLNTARTEEQKAKVQIDFASIRAPFDGIITHRWIDTGATVKDPGMPLFTVMRTDKVRVILDVPERDVPYLRAGSNGNPVRVRIPALKEAAGTEDVFGTVTLMSSALDPVTRTMRTELHLENKVGDKIGLLKPQMTGTAFMILATREAYTVPSSALIRAGNKIEIFIVADAVGDPLKGTLKRIEVQTGLDDGLRVEIKGDNLTGRELVVVKGAGVLRPGEQVIAVPARIAEQ
jgi:RND family efflux transporter MFP subunit